MLSVSRKPGWRSCRRRRRSIRKYCRRSRRPRCKAVDRGQITGALLDSPLALDNAISPEAASIKRIVSPVAGRANVLGVPDLEAGNMLAKSLSFLAGADSAGIVLGARVPNILASRADSLMAATLTPG
jgi:phosphate acetyltransferase